ncbi:tautomerase family protein [Actinoplanes sp. HUAS TT8]|uniref:tautomerase family protein n=1 Tax=Actinoplanes sp. HUAS TT8 TaxID=3447453 RepID=UPI003F51C848
MPHLNVHAPENDLAGNEVALIAGLTEAVVAVYGEWARELVVVRLIGLPPHRWGVGGVPAAEPAPAVRFGIKEGAFHRPDSAELIGRLAAGVTDVLAAVIGERVRPGATIEFVATLPGRTATGGALDPV